MNKDEIKKGIDNLKFTQAMFLFDPMTGEDIEYEQLNQDNKDTYDGCAAGIKALENAEMYRWHDLRKNPSDLPNKQGRYLVVLLNPNVDDIWKTYALAYYSDLMQICNENHWHNGLAGNDIYHNYDKEVIAWKCIEPLDI